MVLPYDRKQEERELHDRLRGDLCFGSSHDANLKFYSINQSNRDFVEKYLTDRCKGKTVLDYCCGNGESALWLADAGACAYGIDISPVSIENAWTEARRRGIADKVVFRTMDAEATEFNDDCFDFVVVDGVLHHLDLERAYRELSRILKPEGAVIATEALRHNVLIHLYRRMTPHLRTPWEAGHILGKKQVEMAKQHFERVEILKFYHLATIAAVPFRNLAFFEMVRRTLGAIDSILLSLPVLRWQAWMVVFELSQPRKPAVKL
jgi:ubiquinone/menaquinone biosynthesis C-methylase UbiE